MENKIANSFTNSRYYRNYRDIDNIILRFKEIRTEYNDFKCNYHDNIVKFGHRLIKNTKQEFLEKYLLYVKKYEYNIKYTKNNTRYYGNYYNRTISINCFNFIIKENDYKITNLQKILNEKINIGHSIKKYIKYSKNIDEDFLKSVEIGIMKNIIDFIGLGANVNYKNNKALSIATEYGRADVVEFLNANKLAF